MALVTDYQATGDEVQLCFQEYKYKEDDMLSLGALVRTAEFLLVMSRPLRARRDNQRRRVPSGLQAARPTSSDWTTRRPSGRKTVSPICGRSSGLADRRRTVRTEQFNRPMEVQIELFEMEGVSTSCTPTPRPKTSNSARVRPGRRAVERTDEDLTLEPDTYGGPCWPSRPGGFAYADALRGLCRCNAVRGAVTTTGCSRRHERPRARLGRGGAAALAGAACVRAPSRVPVGLPQRSIAASRRERTVSRRASARSPRSRARCHGTSVRN